MGAVISLAAVLSLPAVVSPRDAFEAIGGFVLIDLAVPIAPPIPVVSGDVAWHHTLLPGLTAGARYQTHLGAVHRLGPEVRGMASLGGGFAIGGRVYASASVTGSWQDGIDAGGDVATLLMASVVWHHGDESLTLEGGLTVEWLLWEHIAGRDAIDVAPYLAYAEAAGEWRHALHETAWLTLRFEAAVPIDEDPYAPGGFYPRLLVGGGFEW